MLSKMSIKCWKVVLENRRHKTKTKQELKACRRQPERRERQSARNAIREQIKENSP